MSIAYQATGNGPALVLVHGITESGRMWDPLVPDLARDHTVVVVDLPGHGASAPRPPHDVLTLAGAVGEAVDELGVDAPLVVGHSLGGMVVSAYAATRPVRGVVNVDQPLAMAGFQAMLRTLEPTLRDPETFPQAIDAVLGPMRGRLAGAELERVEGLRRADHAVVLDIWAPVLSAPPEELDALVRGMGAAVQAPYLSLHGIDPGDEYAEWLAGVIDGAVVEVWPGVGHYPHLVERERFLARLAAFEQNLS